MEGDDEENGVLCDNGKWVFVLGKCACGLEVYILRELMEKNGGLFFGIDADEIFWEEGGSSLCLWGAHVEVGDFDFYLLFLFLNNFIYIYICKGQFEHGPLENRAIIYFFLRDKSLKILCKSF